MSEARKSSNKKSKLSSKQYQTAEEDPSLHDDDAKNKKRKSTKKSLGSTSSRNGKGKKESDDIHPINNNKDDEDSDSKEDDVPAEEDKGSSDAEEENEDKATEDGEAEEEGEAGEGDDDDEGESEGDKEDASEKDESDEEEEEEEEEEAVGGEKKLSSSKGSKSSSEEAPTEEDDDTPSHKSTAPPSPRSVASPQPSGASKKDCTLPIGVTVYQIEVRFIVFKGVKFCGGVRVLMNCPDETAYLQLITLMNEVFATYDISSIYFLEPRSAAGVSFCAIPWVDERNDDESQDGSIHGNSKNMNECEQFEKDRRERCKEKRSRTVPIDHAEVIFCTPDQMLRFKTVMDTLLCAVSIDEVNHSAKCITDVNGYPTVASMADGTNPPELTPQQRQQQQQQQQQEQDKQQQSFEAICFEEKPVQQQQQKQQQPEPPAPPPPPNLQYQKPSSTTCPPFQKQQPGRGSQGQQLLCMDSSASMVNRHTGLQTFDPCPRGPLTTSICLPCDLGDPYQLNPEEGRVVFCTPACLKVNCRTRETVIYKGKLKIAQGSGGIGFIIRIESNEGATLYCHSLRRDLVLYQTSDVQYGFCYSTVVCTDGRTSVETFVLAFPSSYQMEQFKHAIDTCKDILGMTSVSSLINNS